VLIALVSLAILWSGLIAYTLFGGADFGAGIWDLLAVGRQRSKHHAFITQAIGPIWEANHVWLIFLVMGLFSLFPSAFYVLSLALFLPLVLAVIWLVMRGAAFVFRSYALSQTTVSSRLWGRVFGFSSLCTPFFLGIAAAQVASGSVRADEKYAMVALSGAWQSPFVLLVAVMGLTICMLLAAVYLVVEADHRREYMLLEAYRWRAIIVGGLLLLCQVLALILAPSEAPLLWQGMITQALPLVVATPCTVGIALTTLVLRHYALARFLVALSITCLLVTWGLAQVPYIVPPYLTVSNAANDPTVMLLLLLCIGAGMLIVLPSFYYLYAIFKKRERSTAQYALPSGTGSSQQSGEGR
jgi:cytochrome d ubiquinol oxidase subunit II